MFGYFGDDLEPEQQGILDAHRICAGPTRHVERCLRQAKRRRLWGLVWLLPGRRRYLDSLIRGLEAELLKREEEGKA